ncbi:protein trichome birefringence-like 35 isoform X2 [Arachis hypogaea]|uniref:protein trichome birefringence-like 35 isoform X2 n=1 Tax=Arachis hypogaea TaxID=3818 RepID=UPI000DEC762E|nr:protein trichome birefringence-like 35 isoform X2 [Arachis hypogaea]
MAGSQLPTTTTVTTNGDSSDFTTMQRWKWSNSGRKKTPYFPLLVLFLVAFIAFSTLHSEHSIHQIHENPDHARIHQEEHVSVTYVKPNLLNRASEVLDRFSRCNSTVEYSGRKIACLGSGGGGGGSRGFSGHRSLGTKKCDVFSGKWVFDNGSYPLYNEADCPYMSDQLACHKHGRNDLGYQHWRWQPHNCNLKRFDVKEMWEKLRNKRLMFVGDSLNRGQWISMVCLLQSVIPADKRSMSPNAHLTIFRAEEYNATVEFLWAPLLVESNSDDPVNHRLDERIIRPDTVLKHASKWEHADILVFNTYLWWRQGPVKLLWTDEENGACEQLDGREAMELAMGAWADWVSTKVDPLKKRVFFVTMSPTHLWSREWKPGSEGNCYGEKDPIDFEGYWGSGSDIPTMHSVEKILSNLSSKVSVINITQLSEYRKDGHPSIFRKFWEPLRPEKLANPPSYSDCIHWCLPGVPDVWNELLFHFL